MLQELFLENLLYQAFSWQPLSKQSLMVDLGWRKASPALRIIDVYV
jgi:hypothetical protein